MNVKDVLARLEDLEEEPEPIKLVDFAKEAEGRPWRDIINQDGINEKLDEHKRLYGHEAADYLTVKVIGLFTQWEAYRCKRCNREILRSKLEGGYM